MFPTMSAEIEHFETFGTYSFPAKIFGISCQLGHLCGKTAHPINCFSTRSMDEIVEYELEMTDEERFQSDLELAGDAEDRREVIGFLPVNHYRVQRWLHDLAENRSDPCRISVEEVVTALYYEDVVEIAEEGPDIQLRSTYDCIKALLKIFFLHHHCV